MAAHLPLFVWLGPVWLVFYWFIIFFGYAGLLERIMIVVISLLVALLPIGLDQAATWTAVVDSPVVMSAIASAEHSYQPEALRRMQELVGLTSSLATCSCRKGTSRRPASTTAARSSCATPPGRT